MPGKVADKVAATGISSAARVALNTAHSNGETQKLCTAINSFVEGLDQCQSNVNAWTGGAIKLDELNRCANTLKKHKSDLETKGTCDHVDVLKTVLQASSELATKAIEIEDKRDEFAPNWAVKALAYCADVLGVALCATAICCVAVIAPHVAIPAALAYVGGGASGLGLLAAGVAIKRWAERSVQHASEQPAELTTLLDNTRKLALRAEALATNAALQATLSPAAKEHFKWLLNPPVLGKASDVEAEETLYGEPSPGSTPQAVALSLQCGYHGWKGKMAERAIPALGRLLDEEARVAQGKPDQADYKALQSDSELRVDLATVESALISREGFRPLILVNVECDGSRSIDKPFHSRLQKEWGEQGVVQFLAPRRPEEKPSEQPSGPAVGVEREVHASDDTGLVQGVQDTESTTFAPARVLSNGCVALRFGARFGPGGCIQTATGFYALTDAAGGPRDAVALTQAITTQTRLQWPATGQEFQMVDKLRVLAAMEAGKREAVFNLESADLPRYTADSDLSVPPGKKKPVTKEVMERWLKVTEDAGARRAFRDDIQGVLSTGPKQSIDWHALAKEVDERWASGIDEATFECSGEDCDRVGQHLGVTIIASTPPDATSHSTSADVRSHAVTVPGLPLEEGIPPRATLVRTADTTRHPPPHATMPPPHSYA